MSKNRFGHQQNKGFKTPQQGPVQKIADKPAVVQAGAVPRDSAVRFPKSDIRGGGAPNVREGGAPESRVRSGSKADIGKSATTGSVASAVTSGAAGKSGMSPAGGKLVSDRDNQIEQTGRNGYAMGGKVNRAGVEPKKSGIPAGGGNGGVMGGNAPITTAQPGGTPSTGIVAGGTLPINNETMGTAESRVTPPKLRGAQLKRSGTTPSLPRPRR